MQRSRSREIQAEIKQKEIASQGLADLTVEVAKEEFKKFSKVLASQKRVSLSSFFADPLISLEGNIVHFTVGSKLVAEEIKEETRKITELFADSGYKLEAIECKVNAVEISEYKLFTPKQQFDVMAKEFPMLKEFESRFNLEIDH